MLDECQEGVQARARELAQVDKPLLVRHDYWSLRPQVGQLVLQPSCRAPLSKTRRLICSGVDMPLPAALQDRNLARASPFHKERHNWVCHERTQVERIRTTQARRSNKTQPSSKENFGGEDRGGDIRGAVSLSN